MTHETNNTKMLIIILLALNVLLGVYIAFFKKDAMWLETMKVGGAANMTLAEQLYNSDMYKNQQKATLEQILGTINQAAQQPTATEPAATAPTVTTEETTATK